MFRRPSIVFTAFALTALLAGCGDPPPEMAPVDGVVTIKGKPRAKVLVRFMADAMKQNNVPITAFGETDVQGKYVLRHSHKDAQGEGAPVGWHRVVLEDTTLSSAPQGQPMPRRVIPMEYTSPSSTPLSFEVKPGPQQFDIDVK